MNSCPGEISVAFNEGECRNVITSDALDLAECFIFSNGHFEYVGPGSKMLPCVTAENKPALDTMLKVGYRELSCGAFEYWDKNNSEETEVSLPLYVKYGDKFQQKKYHTGCVATMQSVAAAKLLIPEVNKAIRAYNENVNVEKTCAHLKALLNGQKVVCVKETFGTKEDFFEGEDHFRIVPVLHLQPDNTTVKSKYSMIFDVNKIELNSTIFIDVPDKIKGLVVGVHGWQVNGWCRSLGFKKIHIV